MSARGVCLMCGAKRDRGPYTKYCAACFIKPCTRCGGPNERGPGTSVCQTCKDLPPLDDPTVCRRCSAPNDRGGRTRICSTCLAANSVQAKRDRTRMMNQEAKPHTKWCSTCETYKATTEFYVAKRNRDSTCKSCRSTTNRSSNLGKYGITEADYLEILNSQGGRCAICGNEPKTQRLHVDHDHKTGMVRGLLCLWCNHKVLGGARESPDILQAALNYLSQPPAVRAVGQKFGPKFRG